MPRRGLSPSKFSTTAAALSAGGKWACFADWIAAAKHPRYQRLYSECVYAPMLETLRFLRANGYKTFIVSGGTVDFMRVWSDRVYGVPPEQVVGTTLKTRYELRDGQPTLAVLPELALLDDKAGKPVGIHAFIGRRPAMAFPTGR